MGFWRTLFGLEKPAEKPVKNAAAGAGKDAKPEKHVIPLSDLSDFDADQLPPVAHVGSIADIPTSGNVTRMKLLRPIYRPYPRGIKAHSVDSIICCYGDLIVKAAKYIPLTEDEINTHFVPLIRNFIAYVHLLPASKNHHHSGIGGHLTHSLEVAFNALTLGQRDLFDKSETPTQAYHNKKRWQYACYIAGLLHDIGKPVTDMTVVSADGEHVWDARSQSLSDWLAETKTKNYTVIWRDDREHNLHQNASLWVTKDIVPKETREWLKIYGSDLIWEEIERALSNLDSLDMKHLSKAEMIAGIVMEADQKSCEADASNRQNYDEAELNVSNPAAQAILEAISSLVASGAWKVNVPKGRLWYTRHGLFLVWGKASAFEIIQEIRDNQKNFSVPNNPVRMQQILQDAGAIKLPPDDIAAHGDPRWPVIFCIYADFGFLRCLQLSTPKRIFNKMPIPEYTLALVPGIELTDSEKAEWLKANRTLPAQLLKKKAEAEANASMSDDAISSIIASDTAPELDMFGEEIPPDDGLDFDAINAWQTESASAEYEDGPFDPSAAPINPDDEDAFPPSDKKRTAENAETPTLKREETPKAEVDAAPAKAGPAFSIGSLMPKGSLEEDEKLAVRTQSSARTPKLAEKTETSVRKPAEPVKPAATKSAEAQKHERTKRVWQDPPTAPGGPDAPPEEPAKPMWGADALMPGMKSDKPAKPAVKEKTPERQTAESSKTPEKPAVSRFSVDIPPMMKTKAPAAVIRSEAPQKSAPAKNTPQTAKPAPAAKSGPDKKAEREDKWARRMQNIAVTSAAEAYGSDAVTQDWEAARKEAEAKNAEVKEAQIVRIATEDPLVYDDDEMVRDPDAVSRILAKGFARELLAEEEKRQVKLVETPPEAVPPSEPPADETPAAKDIPAESKAEPEAEPRPAGKGSFTGDPKIAGIVYGHFMENLVIAAQHSPSLFKGGVRCEHGIWYFSRPDVEAFCRTQGHKPIDVWVFVRDKKSGTNKARFADGTVWRWSDEIDHGVPNEVRIIKVEGALNAH